MKLVYLSNAKLPSRAANSVHIMKMCHALAGNGAQVTLLATDRGEVVETERALFDAYGVPPSFVIERIPWREKIPGKTWIYAWQTARRAREFQADHVHGRFLPGIWLAMKMGQTVSFESHSDEFNRSRMHRKMARDLVYSPKVTRIMVISRALRDAWAEAFPGQERKLMVLPDGADPQPGQVDSPVSARGAPPSLLVGYVGQLYPGKGSRMLAELIHRLPACRFCVVGGTEEDLARFRDELRTKSGSMTHLELTGYLPHTEAQSRLMEMDLVLAPYQRTVMAADGGREIGRWMSPLKIFEYMAAGKAIIASDLPVLREVLRDGENARLCDPDRPEQWVETIEQLIDDSGERERLGWQAKQDLETHYSWSMRAAKLLNALRGYEPGRES